MIRYQQSYFPTTTPESNRTVGGYSIAVGAALGEVQGAASYYLTPVIKGIPQGQMVAHAGRAYRWTQRIDYWLVQPLGTAGTYIVGVWIGDEPADILPQSDLAPSTMIRAGAVSGAIGNAKALSGYNEGDKAPVLVGGWDGTTSRLLLTDATGAVAVTGAVGSIGAICGEVLALNGSATELKVGASRRATRRELLVHNEGPNSIAIKVGSNVNVLTTGITLQSQEHYTLRVGDYAVYVQANVADQVAPAGTRIAELD